MRAVNLIPPDARRASARRGRSGGAAHALLGLLALAVLCVAVLTLTGREAQERRAEATRVDAQARAVEAQAGLLGPYRQFAELARARTTRVRELAAGRVDWSFALQEVARVLPRDVRLVALTASAAPGLGAGAAAGSGLRAALPNPALELTGCAPNQARTATLLARLRALDGVERVALATSEKADGEAGSDAAATAAAASDAAGGSDGDDCRAGSDRVPQFSLVVFLRRSAASASAPAATAAATAATPPASAATPPASGGQPPATPTPAPASGAEPQ